MCCVIFTWHVLCLFSILDSNVALLVSGLNDPSLTATTFPSRISSASSAVVPFIVCNVWIRYCSVVDRSCGLSLAGLGLVCRGAAIGAAPMHLIMLSAWNCSVSALKHPSGFWFSVDTFVNVLLVRRSLLPTFLYTSHPVGVLLYIFLVSWW